MFYLRISLMFCQSMWGGITWLNFWPSFGTVTIYVWQLEINLLASTVFSYLDSMFRGFIPHCAEQQWPCVLSVYKDNYSISSKIKNKVNSKLILNLIFLKINRKITRSQNNTTFINAHCANNMCDWVFKLLHKQLLKRLSQNF